MLRFWGGAGGNASRWSEATGSPLLSAWKPRAPALADGEHLLPREFAVLFRFIYVLCSALLATNDTSAPAAAGPSANLILMSSLFAVF